MKRTTLILTLAMVALLLSAGAALAITVRCDGGTCRGTNGSDRLVGSIRADNMYGFAGHDTMSGSNGLDLMVGGNGADQMNGGYAADRMYGQNGGDTMYGGIAADRIFGGSGVDQIFGESHNDYIVVSGDGVADAVNCGTGGADTVIADLKDANPPAFADLIDLTTCENVRPPS